MTEAPRISVVCPTFNSATFVAATLETVVEQVFAPEELIVVDDGSSDDTVQEVEAVFSRARENTASTSWLRGGTGLPFWIQMTSGSQTNWEPWRMPSRITGSRIFSATTSFGSGRTAGSPC